METEYQIRTEAIRKALIEMVVDGRRRSFTGNSIKSTVHCFNANIERVVRDVNSEGLYPFITCLSDGSGVLKLSF